MNRNFFFHLAIYAVLVSNILLLTGCAGDQRGYSAKQHYVLDLSRDTEQATQLVNSALKVRKFRISSRFDQKELVYRTGATKYESDFYNEFFALPSGMITEETQQWLANSGIFTNVVDISSRTEAGLVLEGYIFSLYGDFSERKHPQAVLEIQVFVINETLPNSPVVFQQTYYITQPLQSNQPDALINGLNVCLRNFLTSFEEDLRNISF